MLCGKGFTSELPRDRNFHTYDIKGLLRIFMHWVPQTRSYNLEDYMLLFKWMQNIQIKNNNTFWAPVALVKDDNSTEALNKKVDGQAAGETTMERV